MSFQVLSREGVAGTEAPFAEVSACGPFVLDTTRHRLTRDGQPIEEGNLSVQPSTLPKTTGQRYSELG